MAKIRAIKSMITGEEGESQPPEVTGGTSSTPAGQTKGAVLALASEQPAGRSKKMKRKEMTGQNLVDEDSTEVASTETGDRTEQPLAGKSKGKGPATPLVWAPEFKYQGRAVSFEDSIYADKDYSLGFNLTKGLILPADMKKHDELSDLKVLRPAAKSIVLSLRDAISENEAQKGEIAKLKAAQEAVVAERDTLLQKVDRASEEKQRAVKSTKAQYLAELRKLRDAYKEERDKVVDEAEDRGYKQGEKTYERQVQATKDIFFQCGWKAAVEKVGLGQDAEMFVNPPAAYIPVYMQAYASATQNRLIAEARKETEEEAAAAQQAEQTTAEVSQDDEVADRDVAVGDGADDDAEENLPDQTIVMAEQTVQEAGQIVDLEMN
ncbi:hypothetical protein CsSME_00017965 [Camellia sinensis var. sinensis]